MTRRIPKVAVWVLVFAGAAGVGAFIAAHSNPFPPDVGASPSVVPLTPGPAGSPGNAAAIWKGSIESSTAHLLYVGGRCETDWRGTLVVRIDPNGVADGRATVRRVGPLRCDFSTTQAQIASFELAAHGTVTSHGLELRFTESGSTPSSGADDYGGFLRTILVPGRRSTLVLERAGPGKAEGTLSMTRVDSEGRGTYVSHTRARLACVRGCAGSDGG
ncbi:MAG: hypothetical protein HY240_06350 [Actinobacteria bacterium]|nr:hypothetical protein [Actinomycetota bacterium]